MSRGWHWATLWRLGRRLDLGYLTETQLLERRGDLVEASRQGEAERSSTVVSGAKIETAADRGRARDRRRATVLPFEREHER